jgi:cytochrome c2
MSGRMMIGALPARGYQIWTEAALDAFLRSPEESAPGMAISIRLRDAKERVDPMAYLAAAQGGIGWE